MAISPNLFIKKKQQLEDKIIKELSSIKHEVESHSKDYVYTSAEKILTSLERDVDLSLSRTDYIEDSQLLKLKIRYDDPSFVRKSFMLHQPSLLWENYSIKETKATKQKTIMKIKDYIRNKYKTNEKGFLAFDKSYYERQIEELREDLKDLEVKILVSEMNVKVNPKRDCGHSYRSNITNIFIEKNFVKKFKSSGWENASYRFNPYINDGNTAEYLVDLVAPRK